MTETLRGPGWGERGVGVVGGVLWRLLAGAQWCSCYVMKIRLRAWFVGLQQRWSVRLRACLSLVQLYYDSYYSRHNLMQDDSLQVYNCLVIMEFMLHVGFVGLQRCWSGRFRSCLSLVLRCYDIILVGGVLWRLLAGAQWCSCYVMKIRLRAWFVGLQQRWSVRLRACLSLVQLYYDSYYSRHNLMQDDSLQVCNCLVIMEFMLHVGVVGRQRCWSGRFRSCLSLVLRCYDIILAYFNELLLLFQRFTNQRIVLCISY